MSLISVCEVIYKRKKGKGKNKRPITGGRLVRKSVPGLSGHQIRAALNEDEDSSDHVSSGEEEIMESTVDEEKGPSDGSEEDDSEIEVNEKKFF